MKIIDFKEGRLTSKGLYNGIHLEIRKSGNQVRFYEVNTIKKKEYCLSKNTVKWLVHTGSIPRKLEVIKVLKGIKYLKSEEI